MTELLKYQFRLLQGATELSHTAVLLDLIRHIIPLHLINWIFTQRAVTGR